MLEGVERESAADLSDVALRIGVRSAADVSKTLFRVTAVVPSLGPFASKEITVDLEAQEVRGDGFAYRFEIDPFARDMLLHGLDEITLVERNAPEIGAFESQRPSWLPSVK